MTALLTQNLIIQTLSTFGYVVLYICSLTISVGVAYLIFDFGYKTIILGKTSHISSKILFFDHVPFVKPYKGYNRFRSQAWNIKNTM